MLIPLKMKRHFCTLLSILVPVLGLQAQVSVASFQQPQPEAHVIAWWHWLNGNISKEGLTRDLEAMHAVGINQATFLNVWREMPDADVSQKVRFNSPEWWGMVRHAMKEADRLGMTLGAANCDGWSESGGPWITPDLSMKHYTWSKTKASATGGLVDTVLPQPPSKQDYYRDVCVLAYPAGKEAIDIKEVIDVTQATDVTGHLRWQAPKRGEWIILRFGYTTTGKTNNPATWEGRGLECDKMDTTALNVHFANYPQKIIDLAKEVNPAVFRYFLVDSWEAGPQTWTQHFPEEFLKRRGYDLKPWLPALCEEILLDQRHTEAFLHDFRMTIGDLVNDCYFKHMAELCHRNGLQMYSEGIYGEKKNPPVDVLKTYQYCDVPMTEFWAQIPGHDTPFYYNPWPSKTFIYPVHSSLLYGKDIIGSEAYTGYALYSDSPIDLKTYGDVAFCEGVNSMMLHSYVHQPTEQLPGMTLGVYGQSFNRHNTWFGEAESWFGFQARVQYLLRQGVRCSDALVFTGDELPCPQWTPDESDSIMQGVKFNYINPEVLLSRVTARGGKLWLDGKHEFQCLVLRDSVMELPTLQKVAELAEAGAVIYGPKPVRTLSLSGLEKNDKELHRLADRVWRLPNVHSDVLAMSRQISRELTLPGVKASDFSYIHRRAEGLDLYYIANKNYDKALDFEPQFRDAKGHISLWNPVDGSVYAFEGKQLHLEPQQSLFVVFSPKAFVGEKALPKTDILKEVVLRESSGSIHFDDNAEIEDLPIGTFSSFTDKESPQIRYYSGKATYTIPLVVEPKLLPKTGRLSLRIPAFGSTAKVLLNGKVVTTLWIPNSEVDILPYVHAGENVLSVIVTNPWRNRLIGDVDQQQSTTWTSSPTTMKNDPIPVIHAGASLLPSGISQPIHLTYYTK